MSTTQPAATRWPAPRALARAALVSAAVAVLVSGCDSTPRPSTPAGPTPTPTPTPTSTATAVTVSGVTVAPDTVLAGLDVTATVTLAAAAPAAGAIVTLASSHDAAAVPDMLTVPAGATSATVTVATRDVPDDTRVTLTATSGASSASAEFEITPVPRQAEAFGIEPDRIRGGETATGRVWLGTFATAASTAGAPLALPDLVITLTSSHHAAQVPPSVTVPAGQTEVTFPIVTTAVPQAIALTLTATAGGETRTTGMQVLPDPPVLSGLAPATGAVGATVAVTLTGSGFIAGDTTVFVGGASFVGVSNVTVVNATTLTATFNIHATANPGTFPVTVTTSGGASGERGFTVTGTAAAPAGPTLTSITAASGSASGGTGITLTGTGLTGATGVTFGGVAATSVNVVNSTTVTAVTPARAAGAVNVVINTPSGGATLANGYTYVATAVGQAAHGGIIGALNGGMNNLIAATADNSTGIVWGGSSASATSNEDGAHNTMQIVTSLGNNGGVPYAAQLCSDYEVDSQGNTPCEAGNTCYDDWFLPAGNNPTASGQLNALFTNRAAIGGFGSSVYWSSTQLTSTHAWLHDFTAAGGIASSKIGVHRVRCVRAFTP